VAATGFQLAVAPFPAVLQTCPLPISSFKVRHKSPCTADLRPSPRVASIAAQWVCRWQTLGLYCNGERKSREITGSAGHSCWQGFAAVAILYKEISWTKLAILVLPRLFCISLQMLYRVILSRDLYRTRAVPRLGTVRRNTKPGPRSAAETKHPDHSELLQPRPEAAVTRPRRFGFKELPFQMTVKSGFAQPLAINSQRPAGTLPDAEDRSHFIIRLR